MRWLAVALLCSAGIASAQPRFPAIEPIRESEPPVIDLVTFGVGERIFEKFGHAAICMRYHAPKQVPICFNFGVTDFAGGAPMVWRFVTGTQRFWVQPSTWGAMYGFYRGEDRDIWVQTLPLTTAEARTIEAALWASVEGTSGHYTYDHFFENCTTQLRDLIDRTTGGKLSVGGDARYPHTFRELGRRGLSELAPLIVLADFVLGRQLEDYPTVWEAMFHPTVLRLEIERRLGVTPVLIYKRQGYAFPKDGPTGRIEMLAIALVFALPLLFLHVRAGRAAIAFPYAAALGVVLVATLPALWFAFGPWSLVVPVAAAAAFAGAWWRPRIAVAWAALHLAFWGIVIWGLAIVSSIPGVRWNEAVLVAMPFDLILPFLPARLRRRYAQIRTLQVLLVSLLSTLGVLVQPLYVPILVVLIPMLMLALPGLELQALLGGVQPVRGGRGVGDAEQVQEDAGQDQRVARADEQEPQQARQDLPGVDLAGSGDEKAQ